MLKTMRSRAKALSWTLWLVILAFIGFIFIQWGAGGLGPKDSSNTILWISSSTISGEEFQRQFVRTLESYKAQLGKNFNRNLIMQFQVPQQVLQSLVTSTIVQNEAEKLHLSVSDHELFNAILNIPQFQRDGQFIGAEEYQNLLEYQNIRVEEFEESMRKELKAEKLKNLLSSLLVIDDGSLKNEYKKENDKVELDYIAFKPEELIKTELPVTDQEIADYFNQHRQMFKTPEKRSGAVVLVKYNDLKKEISITQTEISEYYIQNKRELFLVPGKIRVSRIQVKHTKENREEILKKVEELYKTIDKSNFAEKAKSLSEDDKAKSGGDWGYFEWQNFSTQEKNKIENLQPDEISTPIETGEAFSILMVTEKIPEKQQVLAEVTDRIRSTIEREKLKQLASKRINQIYRKVQDAAKLSDGAKAANIAFVLTPLLTIGESIKDVDPSGYISQTLFSLKKDTICQPFEMPDGMAIAQMTEVVQPQLQELEESRESVKKEVQINKKLDALMAKAREISDKLNGLKEQKQIDELLKKESLKSETATYQRGNRLGYLPVLKDLDAIIFNLPEAAYSPPIRFKPEVLVVKPKKKTITTDQDFEKNRGEFYQKKIGEMRNELFSSYLTKMRNEYEVRFNSELFDKKVKEVISRFH